MDSTLTMRSQAGTICVQYLHIAVLPSVYYCMHCKDLLMPLRVNHLITTTVSENPSTRTHSIIAWMHSVCTLWSLCAWININKARHSRSFQALATHIAPACRLGDANSAISLNGNVSTFTGAFATLSMAFRLLIQCICPFPEVWSSSELKWEPKR